MSIGDDLLHAVVELVQELPDEPFDRLVGLLGQETQRTSDVSMALTSPSARDKLATLLSTALRANMAYPTLAAMLSAARAMRRAEKERVELVWTGPNAPSVALYRTEQTLLEMLQSAEKHMLIVTYVAYKVEAVRSALGAALKRGVRIDLVLEGATREDGTASYKQHALVADTRDSLRVFEWPAAKRERASDGSTGLLHAKCAVADDRVLLVSSANLTGSGLELNMELGVRIEGGDAPRRVREHFEALMRRGVLVC